MVATVALLSILVGVVALAGGARLFVDGATALARRVGLSDLAIGLTVVAVGTSSPEIVVTTEATLLGRSDLAVANVVGSNAFNLAVVLGGVALFRFVPVTRGLLRRDGAVLLGSTGLLVAFLLDGRVGRLEGAVLLVLLVAYLLWLYRTERAAAGDGTGGSNDAETGDVRDGTEARDDPDEAGPEVVSVDGAPGAVVTPSSPQSLRRSTAALLVGLLVVVLGGRLLVDGAVTLARDAGVAEWVIGATVVAAGTSTPEFAVSLVAVLRGSTGVSVGNVVGSNVFNALGILGFAASLSPLSVTAAASSSAWWLLALTGAVVVALWSGRRLSRPEGGVLVVSEGVRWLLDLL